MKKLLFIALLACVSPILIAQQKPNVDEIRTKCDLGDGVSCNNLGFLYEKGQGVQQSYQEAVRLYQKGCDLLSQRDFDTKSQCDFATLFQRDFVTLFQCDFVTFSPGILQQKANGILIQKAKSFVKIKTFKGSRCLKNKRTSLGPRGTRSNSQAV